jgi:hypothetical protein
LPTQKTTRENVWQWYLKNGFNNNNPMTNLFLNLKSFIYSPLDQFCDEETEFQEFCRKHIVDVDYVDIIEELELLFTISVGILAGSIAGIELDANDEELEWDEADSALGMNQSAVLVSNLSGVVPGSETITAELSLVFMLSFSTVISYIYFGFVVHEHRYMSIIFPAGTYIIMAPFILMVELISFLARAVSLGMRLFANMFAGHSLFKIIYTFS